LKTAALQNILWTFFTFFSRFFDKKRLFLNRYIRKVFTVTFY